MAEPVPPIVDLVFIEKWEKYTFELTNQPINEEGHVQIRADSKFATVETIDNNGKGYLTLRPLPKDLGNGKENENWKNVQSFVTFNTEVLQKKIDYDLTDILTSQHLKDFLFKSILRKSDEKDEDYESRLQLEKTNINETLTTFKVEIGKLILVCSFIADLPITGVLPNNSLTNIQTKLIDVYTAHIQFYYLIYAMICYSVSRRSLFIWMYSQLTASVPTEGNFLTDLENRFNVALTNLSMNMDMVHAFDAVSEEPPKSGVVGGKRSKKTQWGGVVPGDSLLFAELTAKYKSALDTYNNAIQLGGQFELILDRYRAILNETFSGGGISSALKELSTKFNSLPEIDVNLFAKAKSVYKQAEAAVLLAESLRKDESSVPQ